MQSQQKRNGNFNDQQVNSSSEAMAIARQLSENYYDGAITETDSCINIMPYPQQVIHHKNQDSIKENKVSILLQCDKGNSSSLKQNGQIGGIKIINQTGSRGASGQGQIQIQQQVSECVVPKNIQAQLQENNTSRIEGIGLQLNKFPGILLERKWKLLNIDFSDNVFQDFPMELCSFIQLRVLRLESNFISAIPEEIAFLKDLEELSISNNYLKCLPGSLQNLEQLKILNVANNQIQNIANEVTNLIRLETLLIQNNEFTTFPAKLKNMKCLRELALNWFLFTKPQIEPFISLPMHACIYIKLYDLCERFLQQQKSHIPFMEFLCHFSNNIRSNLVSPFYALNQGSCLNSFNSVRSTYLPLLFDERGRSISYFAIENEEIGVLKAIIQEDPNCLTQVDRENQSLLSYALVENKSKSIQCLLDMQVDPKLGGGLLGTCLHLAATRLSCDLVKRFLASNINPSHQDIEGNTPLHLVFQVFQKDPISAKVISELLLSYGADPNILNNDKWAPLHLAVRKNQKDAVKFALMYNQKVERGQSENIENNIKFQGLISCDQQNISIPSQREILQAAFAQRQTDQSEKDKLGFKSQSCNSLNFPKQDENLSDEENKNDKEKSIGQLPDDQKTKPSTNPMKIFKLDKKGGFSKSTAIHLAASQGNVAMLDILTESNSSCPLALNKFSQTPRRVAMQSLVLFKIIRKYEQRWVSQNIIGEDSNNTKEINVRARATERNIQNLRDQIAETMKMKQHFLQDQLDLFDDKEFGYSIKENMQDNQVAFPRNKISAEQTEEDEIFDPDISLDNMPYKFKFLPQSRIEPESIGQQGQPTHSGTLKVEMLGSSLKLKNENLEISEEQKINSDIEQLDEDDGASMDDIDEGSNDEINANGLGKLATVNLLKNNYKSEDKTCVFLSSFNNPYGSVLDDMNKKQEDEKSKEEKKFEPTILSAQELFSETHTLDGSIEFSAEFEKIIELCTHSDVANSEKLSAITFIKQMFIKLSEKKIKFVIDDKTALPRNVHILNEFLHSKLSIDDILLRKEQIPKLLEGVINQLMKSLVLLPEEEPVNAPMNFSHSSNVLQVASYQMFNRQSLANRINQNITQFLLQIREVFLNFNYLEMFFNYFAQCKLVHQEGKHKKIMFSTCDFSNSTYFDFENIQAGYYLKQTQKYNFPIMSYSVIGSPNYFKISQTALTPPKSHEQKKPPQSQAVSVSFHQYNLKKPNEILLDQSQNNKILSVLSSQTTSARPSVATCLSEHSISHSNNANQGVFSNTMSIGIANAASLSSINNGQTPTQNFQQKVEKINIPENIWNNEYKKENDETNKVLNINRIYEISTINQQVSQPCCPQSNSNQVLLSHIVHENRKTQYNSNATSPYASTKNSPRSQYHFSSSKYSEASIKGSMKTIKTNHSKTSHLQINPISSPSQKEVSRNSSLSQQTSSYQQNQDQNCSPINKQLQYSFLYNNSNINNFRSNNHSPLNSFIQTPNLNDNKRQELSKVVDTTIRQRTPLQVRSRQTTPTNIQQEGNKLTRYASSQQFVQLIEKKDKNNYKRLPSTNQSTGFFSQQISATMKPKLNEVPKQQPENSTTTFFKQKLNNTTKISVQGFSKQPEKHKILLSDQIKIKSQKPSNLKNREEQIYKVEQIDQTKNMQFTGLFQQGQEVINKRSFSPFSRRV